MSAVTVAETAAKGDQLATLTALRDRLAAEVDRCNNGRDLAPLSRQLTLILARIAELAPPTEVSIVDQLAARRAARIADSDAPGRAAERS